LQDSRSFCQWGGSTTTSVSIMARFFVELVSQMPATEQLKLLRVVFNRTQASLMLSGLSEAHSLKIPQEQCNESYFDRLQKQLASHLSALSAEKVPSTKQCFYQLETELFREQQRFSMWFGEEIGTIIMSKLTLTHISSVRSALVQDLSVNCTAIIPTSAELNAVAMFVGKFVGFVNNALSVCRPGGAVLTVPVLLRPGQEHLDTQQALQFISAVEMAVAAILSRIDGIDLSSRFIWQIVQRILSSLFVVVIALLDHVFGGPAVLSPIPICLTRWVPCASLHTNLVGQIKRVIAELW
jgi:hypothetical protein